MQTITQLVKNGQFMYINNNSMRPVTCTEKIMVNLIVLLSAQFETYCENLRNTGEPCLTSWCAFSKEYCCLSDSVAVIIDSLL